MNPTLVWPYWNKGQIIWALLWVLQFLHEMVETICVLSLCLIGFNSAEGQSVVRGKRWVRIHWKLNWEAQLLPSKASQVSTKIAVLMNMWLFVFNHLPVLLFWHFLLWLPPTISTHIRTDWQLWTVRDWLPGNLLYLLQNISSSGRKPDSDMTVVMWPVHPWSTGISGFPRPSLQPWGGNPLYPPMPSCQSLTAAQLPGEETLYEPQTTAARWQEHLKQRPTTFNKDEQFSLY